MRSIAIFFGQFGPYHHARVVASQRAAAEQGVRVVPVQIAGATTTYEWNEGNESQVAGNRCAGLKTLCDGVEEAASPFDVFLKARKLFREEKVDVAFLPSYSPARYFALFAAAKSLGIRTVMMNESHAGTEQATGWKRWIKRQIVKQFDAALVGGEPHKRHFASLGIPADKIFTGYDAVDNALFAAKADEVRSMPSGSENLRVGEEHGARSVEQERPEASGAEQEGRQGSGDRGQSEGGEDSVSVFQNLPKGCLAKPRLGFSDFRKTYGLPQRYFLSLGRMVEKKNLSTLVEAYARFARASGEKHGAGPPARRPYGSERSREHGVRETTDTRHTPVALVFVGSGELERALREQARGLGLRVVDRTDVRVEKTGHGLTRINTDKSERLAADRTEGNAASSVTRAGCEGLQSQAEPRLCETGLIQNCKPNTENSLENDRGAVFFYGFRQIEENPVFYALAEAFVLPSLKEEWGLVVNEAMAAGLPVIVSRAAGCAEDLVPHAKFAKGAELGGLAATDGPLEQRSNGFVFDPSSVDALSEALRRIADQKTKRQKDQETDGITEMGRRSREIVERFSCENFARQALRAAEAASA
jgi:glycosyltransferase involved in cell wall biosynthesis